MDDNISKFTKLLIIEQAFYLTKKYFGLKIYCSQTSYMVVCKMFMPALVFKNLPSLPWGILFLSKEFLLISSALVVKVVQDYFFWVHNPNFIKFYDAISYAEWGRRIFENPVNFFNIERTPLYPIILYLFGYPEAPQYLNLYVFQSILGGLNLLLLWLVARRITKNIWLIGISIFLFLFSIDSFFLQKAELTETVATFSFLLLVVLFVEVTEKPRFLLGLMISSVLIISVLNRPFNTFLFLPLSITIAAVSLYRKKLARLYLVVSLTILILTTLFIVMYSLGNYLRFSYPGVSIVSARNIINNFMRYDATPLKDNRYNLIPAEDPRYSKITATLNYCKTLPEKPDFLACMNNYNMFSPTPEEIKRLNRELNSLSIKYILNDPFTYAASNMTNLVQTVHDVYTSGCKESENSYCFGIKPNSPSEGYFNSLVNLAKFFHTLLTYWFFLVLPVFILYGFWTHWRFKQFKYLAVFCLFCITL
jgi:hypothetical protein